MERKWKWDEITGVFLFALGAGMLLVSVFLSFSSDISVSVKQLSLTTMRI